MSHSRAIERKVIGCSGVAKMFGVDPKTVSRWVKEGKLPAFRTLGGHRRFYEDEVKPLVGSVLLPRYPKQ